MRYTDVDQKCSYRGKPASEHILHNERGSRYHRLADGGIALEYHDTDVVTWYPDDTVILKTGGWFTQTTSRRMEDALDGHTIGAGVHVSVGGNPWRIWTREHNPEYTGYDCPEPYWRTLDSQPYTEGARINLLTGAITAGTMLDYEAHNREMIKAIVKYLKGMTAEKLRACDETGDLEHDVRNGRYGANMLYDMIHARPYGNPSFVFQSYVMPVIDGTARNPDHDVAWIRHELAPYLRDQLLIGPVPIRKNYGHPRKIA